MEGSEDEVEKKLIQLKDTLLKRILPFYAASVADQQAKTTQDSPARGPVWVSRASIPSPWDDSLTLALIKTIKALGEGHEQFRRPQIADVRIQWVGHRPGVGAKEKEPDLSEAEKYQRLCQDAPKRTVLFYLHGGALYSAGTRPIILDLARRTGGRCAALDYRLCPEHPFPESLLDALVAYLSLLYPPAGSFHEAIPAQDIVFAADSAGTQILLALLLLIQSIRTHQHGKINFHDELVEMPMPAGFAGLGVQGDLPHCIPWDDSNHKFDFLLPTSPPQGDNMAPCSIWPSSPPRGDVYCEISAICHPLVSPISSATWKEMPPMFFAYGEEYLKHEGQFIAERAVSEGVTVEWHHYEKLMHIFPVVTPHLPQAKHVMKQWARFCDDCVYRPSSLRTRYLSYPCNDPSLNGVDRGLLKSPYSLQSMRQMMAKKAATIKPWTGPKTQSSL